MSEQEIIYTLALTRVHRLGLINALSLYKEMGSAQQVFEHRKDIRSFIPEATDRLVAALSDVDEAVKRAEEEMNFMARKRVKCLCYNDAEYPQRLKECEDAPLALFYCGNADLNRRHVVNVVGTRRCTEYGKDICRNFIAELKACLPDTLVVSGLAYGIDINAHRAALENGMETVGVLAHGLDTVYPAVHRQTAVEMVERGGLLTEYMSSTVPDKRNFVQRNRIVAGMCDATIVVESAAHGGALITAEIAASYHRDVFAFPGRVYDKCSEGCNALIKDCGATLIRDANDFLAAMNWMSQRKDKVEPLQRELFVELTDEEQKIVDALRGVDDKPVNQIVVDAGLPYNRVSALMFELEMKGVVKVLGGARYRLLT